jgi:uncharacterized protein
MNSKSSVSWNPARLDVKAFAQASGLLDGQSTLAEWPRLLSEAHGLDDVSVRSLPLVWQASAELRPAPQGAVPQVWLHVAAKLEMPLRCQRCLGPVPTLFEVDRWFRFVADEATAEIEDEESEEDVMALEPRPSLLDLIEDELLMELPLVATHDVCTAPLVFAADPQLQFQEPAPAEKPNPFAILQQIKR